MLQTRTGKRTGAAAVRIACEMVKEKLIDEKTAVLRIPADDLTQLLLPSFDPKAKAKAETLTKRPARLAGRGGRQAGVHGRRSGRTGQGGREGPAGPQGNEPRRRRRHARAAGILTSTGGMTSHAAVVARGWGRCCVAGAGEIQIDEKARKITVGGKTLRPQRHAVDRRLDRRGDGRRGRHARARSSSGDFATVMKWADKYRTLKIRTNADTPADAAAGSRVRRRRHRPVPHRAHVLRGRPHRGDAGDDPGRRPQEARKAALAKLLPFQRKDFIGIFTAMKGLPVTIRLLDPPLHEFLPHDAKSQAEMAERLGVKPAEVKARVVAAARSQPDARPSRLPPERHLSRDSARCRCRRSSKRRSTASKKKIDAQPEIMIPLVGTAAELKMLRDAGRRDRSTQVKTKKKFTGKLDIPIGTMIEIPRAALTADKIAEQADFFSFGTNDLTQMTFGFSRDDINTFLPDYLKQELLPVDPFQSLDTAASASWSRWRVTKGRATQEGPQGRHLRRTRRRPGVDRLLPQGRPGLRELLAVPRADRPAGGRAGGAQERQVANAIANEIQASAPAERGVQLARPASRRRPRSGERAASPAAGLEPHKARTLRAERISAAPRP